MPGLGRLSRGGGGIRHRGQTTCSGAPSPAARVLHPGPASPREMGAVRSPEETPLMTVLEADLQSQCCLEQSASQDRRQPVEEPEGLGPHPPPAEQPEPTARCPCPHGGAALLYSPSCAEREGGSGGLRGSPLSPWNFQPVVVEWGELPGSRKSLLECVVLIMPG